MRKISFAFLCLLAFMLSVPMAPAAFAAPSMTVLPVSPKPSSLQPIAQQLGLQLQSLVASTSSPSPGAPDESDEANQEPPPTFGTRALNVVINIIEILHNEAGNFVVDFSALPQANDWLTQQENDPRLVARWVSVGNDLLVTAGIALLGALALELMLTPLRQTLRRRMPRSLAARLALVLSLFALRAVPIIVFIAASVMLLNQYETQKLPRFFIMNVVYALALARITISFLRGVLSPKVEALRFVPATTPQAVYGYRWLRAFALLIIFGYFCIEVARAVHVPSETVTAFTNALGFVLVAMGIIVIVQKRGFVAALLRGDLSAAQPDLSLYESLRLWFARQWHRLAIAYLVIGYMIAAMGIQDGLILMLRGTVLTLLFLVAARLILHEIALWEMRAKAGSATFYTLIKGVCLRLLIALLTIGGCLAAWGVDFLSLASTPIGRRLLGSAFSIGLTFLILGMIYEFFSRSVDRHLAVRDVNGKLIEVNPRSRTLLPMLRNALFVVFLSIIGVVILSEAGINVGPLLAGAGVLGVAVGFGSQTLVKDFLTGLFIVLENTIAVGDVVKIGDHTGAVEAMSMRTVRLRDMDGSLHVLPFSETSQIVNFTRGFSHALIKVNVSHDADLDRAMQSIRAVGEELQRSPECTHCIREPVEILGVDSINDSSVTLLARVRTAPGDQWAVKRLFLLRLKQHFDKDGIPLPNSTTVVLKQ